MAKEDINGTSIGVLEPDLIQSRILTEGLDYCGFSDILTSSDQKGAVSFMGDPNLSIVIFGEWRPEAEAVEALLKLREFSGVPLIYMGQRNNVDHLVDVLNKGADDYLVKGRVGKEEIAARIDARLRRPKLSTNNHDNSGPIVVGPLTIDQRQCVVLLDGKEIYLTPIENMIINLLARNAGEIVPRKNILLDVWNLECPADDSLLRVHISRLRNKLPRGMISTRIGFGYSLRLHNPDNSDTIG
jgi:DNA-binding response OmpR family regulator